MSGGAEEPPFVRRKHAPLTGTAFDSARVMIPCTQCRKDSAQSLIELIVNDDAICPYCGVRIDLTEEHWRIRFAKEAEELKQINRV